MSSSIYRVGDTRPRPLSAPKPGEAPIISALRYGVTAPSAHNTQPWRIELASDLEARVFFDPDRRLPDTDPPGRQVHISHGTLAEMTCVGASSLGYRAAIDVLPEGAMSIPEFGTKPTVVIRLQREPELEIDPLFPFIATRRSSRLPHDPVPVNDEQRRQISSDAAVPGVDLGWIPDEHLSRALEIVADAMSVEVLDHELYEETRTWFRFGDEEIARKGDGLHVDTSGLSGLGLALGRYMVKDSTWHQSSNTKPYLRGFRKTAATTSALMTLTTSTNTMHDWITTGRSYTRAILSAEGLGLRFQPVSQVLQEFPQMDALRVDMEKLVGVEEPAKMQMLVRVGRTRQPGLAPRRSLDDIIE